MDNHKPTCRQQERRTPEEERLHQAYIEELKEAIAEEGRRIKAELAANWPRKNETPTV